MIVEARKTCSGCKKYLPLSDYYARAASLDGRQGMCRDCQNAYCDQRIESLGGRCVVKRARAYGLTTEEVAVFLQIPACQSCGSWFASTHASKFDHCHCRGHFRGVLCNACNNSCQGQAEKAIIRLQKCIDYLRRDLERIGEQV